MNEQEEKLMGIYMAGFGDELSGQPETEFAEPLYKRAYQLGRVDAFIGDEVRSVDYKTNEETLHRIYNIPTLYTVLCAGNEYRTRFKEGDRVEASSHCGVLVLDSIDEFLTEMLKKLHWNTISESYLQGKTKTNNGESYSENEIKPCT